MNNKEPRQYFPFYLSFYEMLQTLPTPEEKIIWVDAITKYAFFGIEPNFSGLAKTAWCALKPNLDASNKKYENACKGGCPPGTKKPSMIGNQNAAKSKNDTKQNQNKTKNRNNNNGDGQRNMAKEIKTYNDGHIREYLDNGEPTPGGDGVGSHSLKLPDKAPKMDF